jgi:hypothetical protein
MGNGFETTVTYVFKMAGCWVFITAAVGGVIVASVGIFVGVWNAVHFLTDKWSLVTGKAPDWFTKHLKAVK